MTHRATDAGTSDLPDRSRVSRLEGQLRPPGGGRILALPRRDHRIWTRRAGASRSGTAPARLHPQPVEIPGPDSPADGAHVRDRLDLGRPTAPRHARDEERARGTWLR